VAQRRAWSARYPCSFWLSRAPAHCWLDRAPWPPSLLRQDPTTPHLRRVLPFRPEGFLGRRLSPHGSQVARGPLYNGRSALSRGCSSAACWVSRLPLSNLRPGQSLLGRLPCLHPGSHHHFLWAASVFRRVLPRFPTDPLSPRGFPGRCGPIHKFRGCGPALARSASYPCPLWQDRAPWPPSLLRQVPNFTSISPGILGFPRCYTVPTKRSLTFRLPASRRARLQHFAPAAVRRAEVSTLPLFIRLEQRLLAASIPAPGLPS
jgi:hypothetical protein